MKDNKSSSLTRNKQSEQSFASGTKKTDSKIKGIPNSYRERLINDVKSRRKTKDGEELS